MSRSRDLAIFMVTDDKLIAFHTLVHAHRVVIYCVYNVVLTSLHGNEICNSYLFHDNADSASITVALDSGNL